MSAVPSGKEEVSEVINENTNAKDSNQFTAAELGYQPIKNAVVGKKREDVSCVDEYVDSGGTLKYMYLKPPKNIRSNSAGQKSQLQLYLDAAWARHRESSVKTIKYVLTKIFPDDDDDMKTVPLDSDEWRETSDRRKRALAIVLSFLKMDVYIKVFGLLCMISAYYRCSPLEWPDFAFYWQFFVNPYPDVLLGPHPPEYSASLTSYLANIDQKFLQQGGDPELFKYILNFLTFFRSNVIFSFISSPIFFLDTFDKIVPKILNEDGIGQPSEVLGNLEDPKAWIKFEY